MEMIHITKDDGYTTLWEYDIPEFEEPLTLESYLREAASPDEYRIDGWNIWATNTAIEKARRALIRDIAIDETIATGKKGKRK